MDVDAELRKMAEDDSVPAHLRLGALKQLALSERGAPPESGVDRNGKGLPADPLLASHPDRGDEDGHPLPPDPMADVDFAGWTGRLPHALYARVLVRVPWQPPPRPAPKSDEARALLDAESRFLRECRDRGIPDAEPLDEVAARRRRRSR